ncbi:MAG: hypothetical protein EOP67_03775 [Sphingomonas sp.]|nr:MAG: hypothetical protein EOP67_03775 [Sphingomonas sp.]
MSQLRRERKQKIVSCAEGLRLCRATGEGARPKRVSRPHDDRRAGRRRPDQQPRGDPRRVIGRRSPPRSAREERQGCCPFVPERQSTARVIRRARHPTPCRRRPR